VSGLHRYTWLTFSRELVLLLIAALWWVPFYFLVIGSLKPEAAVLLDDGVRSALAPRVGEPVPCLGRHGRLHPRRVDEEAA